MPSSRYPVCIHARLPTSRCGELLTGKTSLQRFRGLSGLFHGHLGTGHHFLSRRGQDFRISSLSIRFLYITVLQTHPGVIEFDYDTDG